MQAVAVFPASREIRLIHHPEPYLHSPTEVKIRILEVGLCGTDRELAAFHFGAAPPGSDYLILGHECLAEVVEIGSEVTTLQPGDLVVPEVRRPCGSAACQPCLHRRADLCITGQYTESGIFSRHGYLTSYAIEDERYLHPVPRDLRDVAVLVEPLSIAEKAFAQVAPLRHRLPWAGNNAVVLGAGPIGLLGAIALRIQGFDVTIYSCTDGCTGKAEIAQAIGARFIAAEDTSIAEMASVVGPIDLVYEAAGSSQLTFAAIPKLGPNGIMIITGAGGTPDRIELDAGDWLLNLLRNNQVLLGTVNAAPDSLSSAIRDLSICRQRWPDALNSIITQRFTLDGAIAAIGNRTGIKNVIEVTA